MLSLSGTLGTSGPEWPTALTSSSGVASGLQGWSIGLGLEPNSMDRIPMSLRPARKELLFLAARMPDYPNRSPLAAQSINSVDRGENDQGFG